METSEKTKYLISDYQCLIYHPKYCVKLPTFKGKVLSHVSGPKKRLAQRYPSCLKLTDVTVQCTVPNCFFLKKKMVAFIIYRKNLDF